jgi:hypothetical protein
LSPSHGTIEAGKSNIEIAHHLHEQSHTGRRGSSFEEFIEIVEAVLLAVVAVATAWSGYEAARWDNRRAELYQESSKLRIAAEGLATLGGQERIYDTTTFNSWLNARSRNDQKLAAFLEKRFRNEYRHAFEAWMTLDPFNNSKSPPGPMFMAEYRNAKNDQAEILGNKATHLSDEGTSAGATGDQYVRVTVMLATVLLLTATSQRFRIPSVRSGLLLTALLALSIPLRNLITLPRL